jgi:hypothetical protein
MAVQHVHSRGRSARAEHRHLRRVRQVVEAPPQAQVPPRAAAAVAAATAEAIADCC